jgi:hypothetical protein
MNPIDVTRYCRVCGTPYNVSVTYVGVCIQPEKCGKCRSKLDSSIVSETNLKGEVMKISLIQNG